MTGTLAAVARGALSGIRATGAMTVVAKGFERAGWFGQLPPRQVTERILHVSSEPVATIATTVAHFGYGAAMGGGYALLGGLSPRLVSTATGAVFGVLVAIGSYELLLPSIRVRPPLHRDSPREIAALLIAHLVYGGTLGRSLAGKIN